MTKLGWPKSAQSIVLFFILLTVPIVTVINQQVHNYQSSAREHRAEVERRLKTRSIFGSVYEDYNENQIKDQNEQGVAGVDVITKIRSKNDDDRNDRDRGEKSWSEAKLVTDSNGFFRFELPKNLNPQSSRFRLTVLPPAGYKLSESKLRYVKLPERKKGERAIYVGLIKDGLIPSPSAVICPPTPVCDGELITIDQPTLVCPIYFCYSIDPGQ